MVLGLDELTVGLGCAGTLTAGGGAEADGEEADDPAAWPPVWACAAARHKKPIAATAIRLRAVSEMMRAA
jgi:hypothetical protein